LRNRGQGNRGSSPRIRGRAACTRLTSLQDDRLCHFPQTLSLLQDDVLELRCRTAALVRISESVVVRKAFVSPDDDNSARRMADSVRASAGRVGSPGLQESVDLLEKVERPIGFGENGDAIGGRNKRCRRTQPMLSVVSPKLVTDFGAGAARMLWAPNRAASHCATKAHHTIDRGGYSLRCCALTVDP